ncbi:MAG TPA: hypothetical protein VFZ91_11475 [Allosphingosinicella sp.]
MKLHKFSVRLSSAACLLLAAVAPAAAADSAPAPSNEATATDSHGSHARPPAHATSAPDEPKKICRNIAQTSSRLRTKRICLTREQWSRAKYN